MDPLGAEVQLQALLPFLSRALVVAERDAPFALCLLTVKTLRGHDNKDSTRRLERSVEVPPLFLFSFVLLSSLELSDTKVCEP